MYTVNECFICALDKSCLYITNYALLNFQILYRSKHWHNMIMNPSGCEIIHSLVWTLKLDCKIRYLHNYLLYISMLKTRSLSAFVESSLEVEGLVFTGVFLHGQQIRVVLSLSLVCQVYLGKTISCIWLHRQSNVLHINKCLLLHSQQWVCPSGWKFICLPYTRLRKCHSWHIFFRFVLCYPHLSPNDSISHVLGTFRKIVVWHHGGKTQNVILSRLWRFKTSATFILAKIPQMTPFGQIDP